MRASSRVVPWLTTNSTLASFHVFEGRLVSGGVCSCSCLLNQVLDTLDVQILEPLVVVKKRDIYTCMIQEQEQAPPKTSLTSNTWKDASVEFVVNQGTTQEPARKSNWANKKMHSNSI